MKLWKRIVMVSVAAVAIFGCNRQNVIPQPNNDAKTADEEVLYRQISQDEAQRIMNEETGYIILDVRTQGEYNGGHIPGAICIPNETIDEHVLTQLPDRSQMILVYCRSGRRSKQAAGKLAQLGYTNILEFGGIMTWTGEIEKNK